MNSIMIRGNAVKEHEEYSDSARELKWISPNKWLTLEEAAYRKKTPKVLEKVVATARTFRHYLTDHGMLFSRKGLDEWLLEW